MTFQFNLAECSTVNMGIGFAAGIFGMTVFGVVALLLARLFPGD